MVLPSRQVPRSVRIERIVPRLIQESHNLRVFPHQAFGSINPDDGSGFKLTAECLLQKIRPSVGAAVGATGEEKMAPNFS